MKTINISLCQPRVDNAFGNKTTEFYLVADCNNDIHVVDACDIDDWQGYGSRAIAKALVSHPAIMAGDYDEIRLDFAREIEDAAVKEGVCLRSGLTGDLYVK